MQPHDDLSSMALAHALAVKQDLERRPKLHPVRRRSRPRLLARAFSLVGLALLSFGQLQATIYDPGRPVQHGARG